MSWGIAIIAVLVIMIFILLWFARKEDKERKQWEVSRVNLISEAKLLYPVGTIIQLNEELRYSEVRVCPGVLGKIEEYGIHTFRVSFLISHQIYIDKWVGIGALVGGSEIFSRAIV
jgi:hypothetical protein